MLDDSLIASMIAKECHIEFSDYNFSQNILMFFCMLVNMQAVFKNQIYLLHQRNKRHACPKMEACSVHIEHILHTTFKHI